MLRIVRSVIVTLFFITLSTVICGQDSTIITFGNYINHQDLKEHLYELASDKYEGRETGKKGQKLAADYIANHFKSLNIPGGIDGNYFQEFPLVIQHSGGTSITIQDKTYNFLDDFYFYKGFNDTSFTTTEIVFVGYGIDDKRYSDYDKVDVEGKVVMMLSGEPFHKGKSVITKSKKTSPWSVNWRMKQAAAKEHGAKAILIVPDDIQQNILTMMHYIESPSMMLDLGESVKSRVLTNFYISKPMANEILKGSGYTVELLKSKIKKKPFSTIISNGNFGVTMNRKVEKTTSENVLGFIEGTDKKEEVLVLTAHYDHIGVDKKGEIYNGADDDGSGTVALLELAEAFKKAKDQGKGPRRSILIMPVAGEEKGLLGSDFYSKNPVYPLDKTIADLNIDMIGRIDKKHEGNPDYIYIIGSNMLSTELHDINEKANTTYTQLELDYTYNDKDDPNKYYYRSDHYNFAKNNIPVIFYFNGVHEDYHKSTDTVEKINFHKMEKITRLVFYTAWDLANREERIKVDVNKN